MITGFTVPISHWAHPQHNRGLSEIFHHNNEAIERKTPQKRRKNKHQVPAGYPPRISQRNSAIYIFVPKSRPVPSQQARFPFDLLAQSLRWVNYSTFVMSQTFSAMEDGTKSFYLYSLSLSARPITSTSGTRIPSLSCRKFSGYYVFMRLSMFRQFTFKTFTNFSLLPPLLPFSNKPQMQLAPTECLQKVLHSVLLRC